MLNKTRHIVFFTGDLCCPVSRQLPSVMTAAQCQAMQLTECSGPQKIRKKQAF